MSKAENDFDQTSTPEEKTLPTTPTDAPEYPGTAAVDAMIRSMRELSTDDNKRKALDRSWNVWVAEAAKKWK